MNLLEVKERIVSLFSRKKEEISIPVEWRPVVEQRVAPEPAVKEAKKRAVVFEGLRSRLPKLEPIHIPISMKIRRIVAFLLFVSFCLSTVGSVQTLMMVKSQALIQYTLASLLVSTATAIILLDYLFKTHVRVGRKKKWYVGEEDADANTK